MTPQMGCYAKVSDKPSRYMITLMLKCVTPDTRAEEKCSPFFSGHKNRKRDKLSASDGALRLNVLTCEPSEANLLPVIVSTNTGNSTFFYRY